MTAKPVSNRELQHSLAAAVGAVQQRWGPHSLTMGWPKTPGPARPAGLGRPPWWPDQLGLNRPNVLELAGPASCGKLSLALLWLAEADQGGLIAVLDEAGSFYPPSAAACGLDLSRLVVVRPPTPRTAAAAAALLLGSEGFDAVLWPIGPKTRPSGMAGAKLAHLGSRTGTTLLTLLSAVRCPLSASPLTADSGQPTAIPADVRLRIVDWEWRWVDGDLGGVRLRVQAARLRSGAAGRDWELVLVRERSVHGDGTKNRLRLDAAFPAGGGGTRTTRGDGTADSDLLAERALAGAG